MALSQIQCLDDNNVNPRTHESKPEFFYCEDQRLALETLLRDGRETFFKYLESRGLRGFLSDLELEALTAAAETYDPGKDVFPESGDDEPTPLSQHYWPDLSDTSIPEMDLGWPDSEGYRGVTRTTVYTQPPLEGQVHIKEVVRKMISQAQRVIGVVMDIFTDVDIFRDLLDVCFKKKVSVYILLEHTHLPHFLSMCRRANMHSGHLKHLRVRCTEGAEFYTRSCRKVRGRMGHRFMFVDGDKAVSGSYSFTWMSSRLDRNLITVTTGQAVDGFDRVFRYLYANSHYVDLRQVVMEPEPEPEVLPQPVTVIPNPAAVARKLYNPKYALVAASNPSPTTSLGQESPKEPETSDDPKKKKRRKVIEEDPLPIHPGLVNLEKAYLIPYLPTWPEPDPSRDVIGFINIRDANRPAQVHLQRSEMFETSQAIKFSSPFSKPAEVLPDVAKPRQMTVKTEDMYKQQPASNKIKSIEFEVNRTEGRIKAKEVITDKVLPAQVQKSTEKELPASVPNSRFEKHTIEAPIIGNKLHETSSATNQVPGSRTHINAHSDLRSNNITSNLNKGTTSHMSETLSRNNSQSDSLNVSSLNPEGVQEFRLHTLASNSTSSSQLPGFSGLNSKSKVETQEQNVTLHTDSDTQAFKMQPDNVSASSAAVSSMSGTENNPNLTTMLSNTAPGASVFTHKALSLLSNQDLPRPNPSRPSSTSSSLISPHPVPKPRTVQLLIKDDHNNSQVCLVKKPETSTEPRLVQNDGQADTQMYNEHTRTTKEPPSPKETVTSKEAKSKEADGRLDGKDPYQCKNRAGSTTGKVSPKALGEQGKQAVHAAAHSQNASQQNSQSNHQELISKTRGHAGAPDKTRLSLTDTHVPGLNAQSPDRESRSILSPVRTPTPDRISPLAMTPDSRTPTPDRRSHTPDFRTPTPDVSDGYVSSRDSNLSTTSEEYYECSDSPFREPVFEQVFSSAVPSYRNHSPVSATLSPNNGSSVWSETLARSDRGSASSVIDKRVKTRQAEHEENEKGKEEKLAKLSMVSRAGQDTQETDRRESVDQLNKSKNSTQIAEKVKEPHSPKKRGALHQLTADRKVPPGESSPKGASRTRLSSGDLKPVRVTDGERSAKVHSGRDRASSRERGSSQERLRSREKSLTRRETEEQKRAQQHDSGTPSSRPPKPLRPLTGIQYAASRSWENRTLTQTESKVLEVLESRKSPSRPTPAGAAGSAGSAAGQKQPYSSQQSGASRLPTAVQGRTRSGQTSPQKPQASFPATHANTPETGSKVAPAAEAHRQEEDKGLFSLSFSKLYNLTGLKDKMNKAPSQGK